MARRAKVVEDENWVRPAHSGFEAPAYGEVVEHNVGDVVFDRYGNTCVIVEGGGRKIVKEA